jgi:hypothetical protein
MNHRLHALQLEQDWVVSREQALACGLTRHAIAHRLKRAGWQVLLPSVYLCHPGEPSRRQMPIGALLYVGPDAAIDAADACRYHGVKSVPVDDDVAHVLAPWGTKARSRGYVRVRRTVRPFNVVRSERVRYVDEATAIIAACRLMKRERAVVAALSDGLERRIVTPSQLLAAHALGSPRNAQLTGSALEAITSGVRSVSENDARVIFEASTILPRPVYNCLLRLPGSRLISPDALIVDAGLVHETNGRRAHARDDLFEDMQERHDVMTAAGLTVLHNAPRRLWRCGPEVLAELERCYLRLAGNGLPAGVELVRMAA